MNDFSDILFLISDPLLPDPHSLSQCDHKNLNWEKLDNCNSEIIDKSIQKWMIKKKTFTRRLHVLVHLSYFL